MTGAWSGPRTLELGSLSGRAFATHLRARAEGQPPSGPHALERELARRLGGPGALDRPVLLEAAAVLEELLDRQALEPRARLAGGRVLWEGEALSFPDPGMRIASRSLARFFQGPALDDERDEFDAPPGAARPDRGALFVVTIGPGFEEASRQAFAAGLLLRGLVLDALGSTLAEAAADQAAAASRELLGPGPPGGVVRRYCVGFGDWGLPGQADLFALLRPQTIGVALNPAFLMVPEKSVAGLLAYKIPVNPPPPLGR